MGFRTGIVDTSSYPTLHSFLLQAQSRYLIVRPRMWTCGNNGTMWESFQKLSHGAVLTACSHTFTLFWLIKASVIAEIYHSSFRVRLASGYVFIFWQEFSLSFPIYYVIISTCLFLPALGLETWSLAPSRLRYHLFSGTQQTQTICSGRGNSSMLAQTARDPEFKQFFCRTVNNSHQKCRSPDERAR